MNKKTIEQAKNPLLPLALVALERAALRARLTAIQTGTDLIVSDNGRVRRITPDELRKELAEYLKNHPDLKGN